MIVSGRVHIKFLTAMGLATLSVAAVPGKASAGGMAQPIVQVTMNDYLDDLCTRTNMTQSELRRLRRDPAFGDILAYTLEHCPEMAALLADQATATIPQTGNSNGGSGALTTAGGGGTGGGGTGGGGTGGGGTGGGGTGGGGTGGGGTGGSGTGGGGTGGGGTGGGGTGGGGTGGGGTGGGGTGDGGTGGGGGTGGDGPGGDNDGDGPGDGVSDGDGTDGDGDGDGKEKGKGKKDGPGKRENGPGKRENGPGKREDGPGRKDKGKDEVAQREREQSGETAGGAEGGR